MKSIVEEASSIVKAVEKAWVKAGKPKEFSIKVFEEATKNFLGITTKSAKIGLFFTPLMQDTEHSHVSPERGPRREKVFRPDTWQEKRTSRFAKQPPQQESQPPFKPEARPPRSEPKKELTTQWTQDMIAHVTSWMQTCLKHMGNATATVDTVLGANGVLQIGLQGVVFDSEHKERAALKSLSHLVMEVVSCKFKKAARRLKVRVNCQRK